MTDRSLPMAETRRPQVPDILVLDEVARSSGASIVVALAATLAVVLTALVATLSGTGAALATPLADGMAAGRDVTFSIAGSSFAPHKSVAIVLVGALLFGMTASAGLAWRALTRALVEQRPRRPARRSR